MVGVAQNTDRIVQNMDLGKLEGVEAGFDSLLRRTESELWPKPFFFENDLLPQEIQNSTHSY